MQSDRDSLRDKFHDVGTKISLWQREAKRLRDLARSPGATPITVEELESLEETALAITAEMGELNEIVRTHGRPALHAPLITELEDTIRLVLLDITEVSIALYREAAATGSASVEHPLAAV